MQQVLQALAQGMGLPLREVDARMMGALELAYVGDTLHDMYARVRLVKGGHPVGKLHRQATALVCAQAQAKMADYLAGALYDAEIGVLRRGRNAHSKHTAPKHADPVEYQKATALEALWGYLFLSGQYERLSQLMGKAFEMLCPSEEQ